ncbi:collagen alpha-6(VI) chain-like isoform X2 [Mauremys reevesii]|uniref:collagen alpha-6(VI) chain-like isoform X2 n=1 Tax=Mauremys reevesii TaxID=260615 RepID=UPI00193F299E|nr:collagen alpha-6(VI) chain-like isoform X2 [Mauremys reevesii]
MLKVKSGLKLGTFIHNMKMLLTLFLFLSGSQTSVTQMPGYVDTEEADIYVLIDGSTSISPVAFGDIKIFLKEVIKMFNIGPNKVRFGAVQFSHNRRLEFELDEYSKTNDLETAIDTMRQITGDTYTGEALTFMQPLFKKAREQRAGRVPCHLIVLTDGESHDSVKEPAERLRSETVNIYAIGVKDANEAQLLEIAGSKSRTFFVQEFDSLKNIKNEIVQVIRSGEACKEMTADIMFLVDSSGSIGPENFSKMKNFMRELVNKSDISADRMQVGVVQFSDINKEEFQLDRYSSKSDIFSAIDRMSLIGENTLTGSALTFVADYFKPPKGARLAVKKFLILITDGEAQDEVKSPARALRDQDVIIYSVGVFNANKSQLEEISGKPELVFYVENFDSLKHIEDEIIFGICRPHEEFKKLERLDVVFVIDGSGSISPVQYQTMKDFMIALVKKSDVAPDRVQFGAVKYSDKPETFFYLNKYTTKSKIVEAIQNDRSKGGSTYTAKAIGYSEALFAQEHGGRKSKGVPQILIVITDGASRDAAELGDAAKRLRDSGIIIYAVGIEGANPDELLAMAGSEDKYYYVDTFEGLKITAVEISEKICDDSKPDVHSN